MLGYHLSRSAQMDRYPNLIVDHRFGELENGIGNTGHAPLIGDPSPLHPRQQFPQLFADVPHNFYGPCKVCDADATGLHYGVATCEGCKGFFKRSLESATGCQQYTCATGLNNCIIKPQTRNACRACRLQKCKEVGMEWKAHRKRIRMKSLINGAKLDMELQVDSSPGIHSLVADQQQPQRFSNHEPRGSFATEAIQRNIQKTSPKAVQLQTNNSADDDDDLDMNQRNGLDGNFEQLFTTVDELLQSRQHDVVQRPSNISPHYVAEISSYGHVVDSTPASSTRRLNGTHSPFQRQLQTQSVEEKHASLSPSANEAESRFRRSLPPKKAYTWSTYSMQQHYSAGANMLTAHPFKSEALSPGASLSDMRSSSVSKSPSARDIEMEADRFLVDHLSHLMHHNLALCPAAAAGSSSTNDAAAADNQLSSVSSGSSRHAKDKSNRNMLIHRFDVVGLLQDYLILQVLKRTSNSTTENPVQRLDFKRKNEYETLNAISGLDPTTMHSDPCFVDEYQVSKQKCLMLKKRVRGADNDDVDAGVRHEIRRCIMNMMHGTDKTVSDKAENENTGMLSVQNMLDGLSTNQQIQQFLAEFTDHQSYATTEQSPIIRVGDILRPNTTVITTSVQQLHRGFIDCFLEPLAGGRSLQRLLRERPVYEPQTTIDGFMSAFAVYMAQMAVLGVRFGNNFVPGFWRIDDDVRHFCVQTNLTLVFYTIFAELIEQNNSYVVLNDLGDDKVHIDNRPQTDLADCLHTSYYWVAFVMPEGLMKFNKELAAFISSMRLPDRIRIILSAAAWCCPPDFSHIPERFRSLILASMTRLTRRKLAVYQRELRPMHDYLLRVVMAAINFCYGYDEQEARTLRNKILFLFRVVTMRLSLFTCYFVRNIPVRFYDDGSFDWQNLQTFRNMVFSPEMTHWMNGIWTLANNAGVVDFSDLGFDVELVARQIELALADMGGGSVASWTTV